MTDVECTPSTPCHSGGCPFCDPGGYLAQAELPACAHDKAPGLCEVEACNHNRDATEFYRQRERLAARPEPAAAYVRMASRLLTRDRLASLPPLEPLIADTLERRTVAVLAGRHATGKSFIALDWSLCLATGKPWQGRDTGDGTRVLYVASEGAYGLHQRIAAWEYAWSRKVDADRFAVLPEPVNLGAPEDVAAVSRLACDGGATLVVFDTLARCAVGLDENSARDMGRLVDAAYQVSKASKATVLLVHHTGKDGATVRGSSALEAGVDTVYLTEGDAALIKLSRTKRKDGPMDDRHTLSLKPVQDSCVVEYRRGPSHEPSATDRGVLKILCDATATGPMSRADLRDAAMKALGIDRATAYRAMKRLVDADLMRDVGTEKRPAFIAAGEVTPV